MKDVYEVLRLKELERSRVEVEVEALRIVAPLVSEEDSEEDEDAAHDNSSASSR